MHEIEEMIRLVLKPGPQRGRDVYAWVCDASGYSRRSVRRMAEAMEDDGSLFRGMWICPDLAQAGASRAKLYVSLSEAILRQREAA